MATKKVTAVKEENVYQRNGYANRREYLRGLADDYGVKFSVVVTLAEVLGPNEDFDGLVSELDDYSSMFGDM